jgi:hypothetical protein
MFIKFWLEAIFFFLGGEGGRGIIIENDYINSRCVIREKVLREPYALFISI